MRAHAAQAFALTLVEAFRDDVAGEKNVSCATHCPTFPPEAAHHAGISDVSLTAGFVRLELLLSTRCARGAQRPATFIRSGVLAR
eukprot:10626-Eustigmatos_ZCMA.PRE.1